MAERVAAVLGIDLGTSEAKAALVALDGRLLGVGRGTYPTDVGADGRAEQDPRDWWAAIASAVGGVAGDVAEAEVLAICCVGQGPTLTAVDADAAPVRPALTWQDRRAGAGGYGLLPRMAWLARDDPDGAARARWLLASWDAAGLWLSGEAATTVQGHEAALTEDELVAAGVRTESVPPALAFGSRLGSLRPTVAAALGLQPGTPVVAGVNDGTASMLGAGLRLPGDAVDTGGTSGGIGIYTDRAVRVEHAFLAPAPLPDRWVVGGAMAALGASVDWVRTEMLDGRWTRDELFEAAATVEPGAGGLVFLPYLAGERAPIFDEHARGVLFGLTLAHGPADIARAALEGAALAVRHVAEPLGEAGAPIRELRPAGKATPGDLWARIKADVLGVPVAIPAMGDTAVVGAAILAAVGVGAFTTLEEGVTAMTSVARRLEPDAAAHARYDEVFGVYRALYPALRPLFHRDGGD
ncbi:MAG TPA: FGGY-family carbohydrate kinase [Candidatus Limnocylindrales bacterium]|nr:FGGY-family carbohydrate kinase [Candidatus Limnocylindrales bacterium]